MAEDRTSRLNLLKPVTDAVDWEAEVENWADKLDEAAAGYITFHLGGMAVDEEVLFDDFLFDEAVEITKLSMYARLAPTGSAFQVDFLKNSSEQSKLTSINVGQNFGSAAIAGLSYDPGSAEKMGLKVKAVGSTEKGGEIDIVVHYNVLPVS